MTTKNSKTAKYTSGPWHIGMHPGPMVYGSLGEQIADCRGLDESGQNARLIAAAPDLLAACEAVERFLHGYAVLMGKVDVGLAESLRAAIAKARGGK